MIKIRKILSLLLISATLFTSFYGSMDVNAAPLADVPTEDVTDVDLRDDDNTDIDETVEDGADNEVTDTKEESEPENNDTDVSDEPEIMEEASEEDEIPQIYPSEWRKSLDERNFYEECIAIGFTEDLIGKVWMGETVEEVLGMAQDEDYDMAPINIFFYGTMFNNERS